MTAREEILQMAEEGVITQEEAQRLLDALGESASGQTVGDTVQEKPPACPPEGVITGCGTRTENPGKKIRVEVEVGGLQLLPSADGRLYSEVKLHSMRDRLSNYNYGVEERGEETVVHMSRKLFRPWGRNEGATLVVYVPRDTAVADCKVNVGGCTAEGVCADQLKLRTETGGIQLTGVHAQEAFVETSTGAINYGKGNAVARRLSLKANVGAVSARLPLDNGFHLSYCTNVGKVSSHLPASVTVHRAGAQNLVGDSGELTYGDGSCAIQIQANTGAIRLTADRS